jgi:hypothetical protein
MNYQTRAVSSKTNPPLTLVLRGQSAGGRDIDKQDCLILQILQRDGPRRLLNLNTGVYRSEQRFSTSDKLLTLKSKRDILADELNVRMLVDFETRARAESMMRSQRWAI